MSKYRLNAMNCRLTSVQNRTGHSAEDKIRPHQLGTGKQKCPSKIQHRKWLRKK